MVAKGEIQKLLQEGIKNISARAVGPNENLLVAGVIDSLGWVELIDLVDSLAKRNSKSVDLESLLTRKELSLNMILEILGEEVVF